MKENRAEFQKRLKRDFSDEEIRLIDYAYDLSKAAHRTQYRIGGDRYFEHPRAVCLILLDELKVIDADLLIALLLHDVGEDTPLLGSNKTSFDELMCTLKYRLEKIFNQRVSKIVALLTKPYVDNVKYFLKEEIYTDYINKLKEDENAIFCKGIDRLHNLRSLPLDNLSFVEKQIKETKEVFLPIFKSVSGPLKEKALILSSLIESQIVKL